MCTQHRRVSFIRTHRIGRVRKYYSSRNEKKYNSYTNLTMFQGQAPIMYAISGRVCVPYECVRRYRALMRCILDIGRLLY